MCLNFFHRFFVSIVTADFIKQKLISIFERAFHSSYISKPFHSKYDLITLINSSLRSKGKTFGNAAPRKRGGGRGGGTYPSSETRVVLTWEFVIMNVGFLYVRTMPCPSSGVERSEELYLLEKPN